MSKLENSIVCREIIPLLRAGLISPSDKLAFLCKKHGVYEATVQEFQEIGCPSCSAESNSSPVEKRIVAKLSTLGIEALTSCRNLISYNGRDLEIDIYLPLYRVAVEVNGIKYHTVEALEKSRKFHLEESMKFYHRMKIRQCYNQGIQLINLYSDELYNNFNSCIEVILVACEEHGRQSYSKGEISYKESEDTAVISKVTSGYDKVKFLSSLGCSRIICSSDKYRFEFEGFKITDWLEPRVKLYKACKRVYEEGIGVEHLYNSGYFVYTRV